MCYSEQCNQLRGQRVILRQATRGRRLAFLAGPFPQPTVPRRVMESESLYRLILEQSVHYVT